MSSSNGKTEPPLRVFGTPEQREKAYQLWTENKSIRNIQQILKDDSPDCPCASTSTIHRWIMDERDKRKEETALLTDAGATRELLAGTATTLLDDLVTVWDPKELKGADVLRGLVQLMTFLADLNGAKAPIEVSVPDGAFSGPMQLPATIELVLAEIRKMGRMPNGLDVQKAYWDKHGNGPPDPDAEEIIG